MEVVACCMLFHLHAVCCCCCILLGTVQLPGTAWHAHLLYVIAVSPLYENVSSQVHEVNSRTAVRHDAYTGPAGLAAAFVCSAAPVLPRCSSQPLLSDQCPPLATCSHSIYDVDTLLRAVLCDVSIACWCKAQQRLVSSCSRS
ncbi:hypothetical protein COO60DRAFT_228738 [Scenedesmus sp. NREL 46B-D3]|nr:hypothetical protein COO60DRAFT_228738 [Scenedesmus sp. NREL 46B-D3]